MAEATRRKVYDMLVADKMRVQGFHYPFPAIGYVEKDGTGYRLVAGAVDDSGHSGMLEADPESDPVELVASEQLT